MGAQSQSGSIVLRTQSVPGTYNADTLTAGVGLLTKTGSLVSNRTVLMTDPEIGGGRDVTTAYLGSAMWNGTYAFYVRMEALKTLVAAAFGTTGTPSTALGVTTQPFTPSDSSTLPFLSIHEEISDALESYNYNDVVCNTFDITCAANALMDGTAGFVARNQVAGATRGVATTIDNTPVVVATNINLTYNSVAMAAKSFTFAFTNNYDDTDFRLGSFFLGDLTPKRRGVTCQFTIRESSSALWRQATYGVSGATAVGGVTTQQALVITADTYEIIPGGGSSPYELKITIPKFMLDPYSLVASGDTIIESGLSGNGLRPALGTPISTVQIKSATATVA